jgi:TonB family protein
LRTTRRILLVCGCLLAIVSILAQTPDAAKTQARDMLSKGMESFKNGDSQLALDSFRRALELDPELTNAELYLGAVYASMSTAEGNRNAIQSFERVLAKQPGNPEALSRLAAVYMAGGDHARARSLYFELTARSPQDATAFYSLGALDWLIVRNRTNPLSDAEKRVLVDEGLRSIDAALRINPQYVDALAYKNLLLREKAAITQDLAERTGLLAEADVLFAQALDARRAARNATQPQNGLLHPPPPPLPQDSPIRVGSTIAGTNLVRNVAPVYPPAAQAARIQGTVLLQTTIDKTGHVASVSVISGHPLLNDAAIDAVKQWTYQPILLNGQPIDVITTVTVNFTLQ